MDAPFGVSAEARAKMSAAKKGRSLSPEHRANLSAATKGRSLAPEHKAKLVALNKARPRISLAGALSSRWKGGRRVTSKGYVTVAVGPYRRRYEHRVVMERMIGRPLLPTEQVHHKNQIRDDNRPENLRLFASKLEHMRYHGRLRRARKFITPESLIGAILKMERAA